VLGVGVGVGVGLGFGVGVGVAVGLGVGASVGVGVSVGMEGTGTSVVVRIGSAGVRLSPDAGTGPVDGAGLVGGADVLVFGCCLAVDAGDATGTRGTGTTL